MRRSEVKIGQIYWFDPSNLTKQYETGFNSVYVLDKRPFKRTILVCPVYTINAGIAHNEKIEVDPFYLHPRDEKLSYTIRYPVDSPSFSMKDYEICLKMANMFLNSKERPSDADAVLVQSLLSKIEFYKDISEANRPVIIEEENGRREEETI